MKIYCPSGAAVVRAFVGNQWGPPKLVVPDSDEVLVAPDLARFGFPGYEIPGILVLRQAGYVQLDLADQSEVLVVPEGGGVGVFRRPFPYWRKIFEGICAVPHHQSQRLGL